MKILGISAFYHDSAACLVVNGEVIAAAQEERFSRVKHDKSFPKQSIEFCLTYLSNDINEIDLIVYYEDTKLKFRRLVGTFIEHAPKGMDAFAQAIPTWFRERLHLKENIKKYLGYTGPVIHTSHHMSHAASAFFPSPFSEAAILTMDGVGEWSTTSFGIGKGNKIELLEEMHFPHSLGLLYSAFTFYCGFKVNSGEYKLMGLAPYGSPRFADTIKSNLLKIKSDGSFALNMEYFDFAVGKEMVSEKFDELFGYNKRQPEAELQRFHADLAASIQQVTEDIILLIARNVRDRTGMKNLCLSGGVALNCVANGKLYRSGLFEDIWVQPASGDAGSSLGAALWGWYHHFENERTIKNQFDMQNHSLLGPRYQMPEILDYLRVKEYPFLALKEAALVEKIVDSVISGKIVGLFNGRMEFGPRALGSRSIIADPRNVKMQRELNLKTKFRESFRPFAPIILSEEVEKWFDVYGSNVKARNFKSPFMLNVSFLKKDKRFSTEKFSQFDITKLLSETRSDVPAVTHVDYSARLQTVHSEISPFLHKILKLFFEKTGCPMLINTSFNVRNEPIILDYKDAYKCFMRTNIDCLILEQAFLQKGEQPKWHEGIDWRETFKLD